tara:strand:+ start:56 stop:331 length:276 start_codon:yes stop_codon:yes gene_type:complete
MGNLCNRVNEVMDKIYDNNSPSNATALEEELAKKLKESFEDCYKNAANELNDPEEEIPSPGVISSYIEDLPEAEQAKALVIVNDWFDNLES